MISVHIKTKIRIILSTIYVRENPKVIAAKRPLLKCKVNSPHNKVLISKAVFFKEAII